MRNICQKVSFINSYQYILKNISEALNKLPSNKLKAVVNCILSSRCVFVYGAGRSGLVINSFAKRLGHLGIKTYVIGESITPPIESTDCVIFLSGSGKTKSLIKTAEITKKIAKNIIITGNGKSKLASYKDILLVICFETNEVERAKLAPLGTLFEDTAMILLDCIIVEIMHSTNQTECDMSARHAIFE